MVLENELRVGTEKRLSVRILNQAPNVQDRVDEIADFIRKTPLHTIILDDAPITADFGHRISRAIVCNPHVKTVVFCGAAMKARLSSHLCPWITSCGTLANMSSLTEIAPECFVVSDQEVELLSSLLSTCTSSRLLKMWNTENWSDTSFAALCQGVARSSLQNLDLTVFRLAPEADIEHMPECLARAIAESSLEVLGHLRPWSKVASDLGQEVDSAVRHSIIYPQ